jgi:CubicO group peptidase (beta-lactamase class C family)
MGGELVHHRGLGTLRHGQEAAPDADSVFRIASMTKSFTAATVISLRDEGRLSLDDPVARWVPELAALAPFSADSPAITIRHLLTMSAGFPTDDPWGDRQQGLDLGAFSDLLRRGPSLVWAPGTRFEYSNLGYGILGRVITNVTGREYRDEVTERFLRPLGMTSTTYTVDDVPRERLALGYVRRDDAWLPEPMDPYGALAAMGGVFTSVRDLARWVAGFLDAFPPRDDPEGRHPVSRASRREMQQIHRTITPRLKWSRADGPPVVETGGYGYGLFITDDMTIGRTVGHGGGYPGFGSHMRWHPASGIGVIAFGNGRYAPMTPHVIEALRSLVSAEAAPVRRVAAWPATLAARDAVERLLERWDDVEAADLFAMNVDLDEPLALRRAAIERLREAHDALRPDETVPAVSTSAADLIWWMTGERGRVRLEILLSPERPPKVQALRITSVLEPSEYLLHLATRVTRLLGESAPVLPPDITLATDAGRASIERDLRAAAARLGHVTLGRPTAGDGVMTSSWALEGEGGGAELTIRLESAGGAVADLGLVPSPMEPPRFD